MKKILKTALVQTDTIWENINENLQSLSLKLNSISENIDVIILPELFSTGFTMNAKPVAESMNGKAIKWMLEKASDKNSLIIGSLIISENENIYNRLIAAFPNGEIQYYDKRHLFSYAEEDKVFTVGNKRLTIEYKGWKILPLICYDLRFPVWARNTDNVDLIIYVANWPNARIYAWDTLLKARAIENLCYVIGVNRVGIDNNDLIYTGHSAVNNAFGETLLSFEEGKQEIKIISLQKDHIAKTRNRFRFLEDKDVFEIK